MYIIYLITYNYIHLSYTLRLNSKSVSHTNIYGVEAHTQL